MTKKPGQNGLTAVSYDTGTTLLLTANRLRAMIEAIDGSHPSSVREIARLSTALITTCSEIRQHAKAAVRELSRIPLEQIVTYLKTLPADQRDAIAREITGSDAEESLL